MRPANYIAFLLLALFIGLQGSLARAQTTAPAPAAPDKPPISAAELEQLVAPIALYPDSVISQILMASTYPLEVVQAQRYVKANPKLTGEALATELEKQPWDPSVKSLINFPQVLDLMNEKLDATIKLGDAFLDDQKTVLDAIQRLRAKAKAQGNLETTKEQTIIVEQAPETKVEVIRIEPTNPQVVYVPTYNPTVVYGTWPYPAYPPYYYHPPGYVASAAVGFGVGLACGAAWGYAWGNCNWGGGSCDIDVNRNFNSNRNIDRSKYQNRANQLPSNTGGRGQGNNSFRHDPSHRQGVAYRDNKANQKFGGGSGQAAQSRDAYRGRAEAGRQDISRGGADSFRGSSGAGAGNRPSTGGPSGTPNRGAGQPAARPTGGAPSRGSASPSRPSSGSNGLSGAGSSGSSARSASQRGASSRSSSGASRSSGGGGRSSGGGGGRGGGGGGGGGRR